MTQPIVIDAGRLAAVALGCGVSQRTLLEELVRSNAADSVLLRAAVDAAETTILTDVAHRIGGAARMLGADALASACDALCASCAAGVGAAALQASALVETELARLQSSVGGWPA